MSEVSPDRGGKPVAGPAMTDAPAVAGPAMTDAPGALARPPELIGADGSHDLVELGVHSEFLSEADNVISE
jgi:hypothetical protein